MEAVTFFIAAGVALAGACGVVLFKNPVHAALSLVGTLFGVAIHFINLEAYFLAAVQVIVYAGAIVILFLFVIMLLGVDRAESIRTEPIIGQRHLALLALVALLIFGVLIGVASNGEVTGVPPQEATYSPLEGGLSIDEAIKDSTGKTIAPKENIREVGRSLFSTRYVFALEITALLLTIAVIGAVVLTRRPKGEPEPLPEDDPPSIIRSADNEIDLHLASNEDDDSIVDMEANESEKHSAEESGVSGE
ncbi:MAG: NADH-quinone oxidoreductase subunit J [Actinomycetota bacterium]|nr:NADH-quinone oxidoreductase subunit J [Actinomycetota bacterium]